MFRSVHRLVLALVLGLVLVAPAATMAQPGRSGLRTAIPGSFPSPDGLFTRAWDLVFHIWDKAGCLIDPSGVVSPSIQTTSPAQGDAGCLIDPSGVCVSSMPQPAGCGIDPSGHC